ncbi:MAG: HAMP domain-containing protein [Deltaproteobacteria bacterium]|nr:HAMP domain-containing protein [Deltaproteobacteria bacterium]
MRRCGCGHSGNSGHSGHSHGRHGCRHGRGGAGVHAGCGAHAPRARLRRRIFAWFGLSILVTGLTAGLLVHALQPGRSFGWHEEVRRVEAFLGGEFARRWEEPAARDALAASLADHLALAVRLEDAGGRTLLTRGGACEGARWKLALRDGARELGRVEVCAGAARRRGFWRMGVAFVAAGLVLWGAAGLIARRLTRSLSRVAQVAEEIGAGRLSSRVELHCREPDEVGQLATTINEMAARIEAQLREQRELLAAVSHELRTPLARLRVLAELLREGAATPERLEQLDREVTEMDALVGELLASARVDFQALSAREVLAAEVARDALERASQPADRLEVAETGLRLQADPTLLARALANLIENAERHGGGLARLRVRLDGQGVCFEAEDQGPGLPPGEEQRLFEPFYRRPSRAADGGSLGLGLALVARIAQAHGGRAFARNLEGGGAVVGFVLPGSGAERA